MKWVTCLQNVIEKLDFAVLISNILEYILKIFYWNMFYIGIYSTLRFYLLQPSNQINFTENWRLKHLV